MKIRVGIGQDAHRFLSENSTEYCVIGGVPFENVPGFRANSDGDVVFHALCNAISSLTGVLILGNIADEFCLKQGITDSRIYLEEAVKTLGPQKIVYVSISLEGKRPHFKDKFDIMKKSISDTLGISPSDIGITATTADGLTDAGCGEGVYCTAIVTTQENLQLC